jgi:hypothetical protein
MTVWKCVEVCHPIPNSVPAAPPFLQRGDAKQDVHHCILVCALPVVHPQVVGYLVDVSNRKRLFLYVMVTGNVVIGECRAQCAPRHAPRSTPTTSLLSRIYATGWDRGELCALATWRTRPGLPPC